VKVDGNRIVLLSQMGPTRASTSHAPNRSARPDLRRIAQLAAVRSRVLRQDYDHISGLIEKEPRNVSGQAGTGEVLVCVFAWLSRVRIFIPVTFV